MGETIGAIAGIAIGFIVFIINFLIAKSKIKKHTVEVEGVISDSDMLPPLSISCLKWGLLTQCL